MFKTLPPPDPTEFAGKRAIVTGGSRGLGAAIVQRLLDGGATVVTTARNATDETPKAATFIPGDISTFAGARKNSVRQRSPNSAASTSWSTTPVRHAPTSGASHRSPTRIGSTHSTRRQLSLGGPCEQCATAGVA